MNLDEIYSLEWFAGDFAELQPEFDVVADALYRQFRPGGCTDVGCGPGMVVRRLRELGVEAWGLDGSRHALAYAHADVRPFLDLVDITAPGVPVNRSPKDGLIICTEVAEHLEARHAAGLVALLCAPMAPIVFTAAPPGQDGHHHVNCQPQAYWLGMFAERGVICDWEATSTLKARWSGLKRLSHMQKNVMVLR